MGTVVAVARRYGVSRETVRRRLRRGLRGVNFRAIRIQALTEEYKSVIPASSFRLNLASANYVFEHAGASRGLSSDQYVRALRAGGVDAKMQAQILHEARIEQCLRLYLDLCDQLDRQPTAAVAQEKAEPLYNLAVLVFGTWGSFLDYVEHAT